MGGAFVYNRLPFGLKSGPASMQKLMQVILQGLDKAFVYLDDILLFSETEEEHVKLIEEVLKRLSENHMPLSVEKCQFGVSEVEYLGYLVNSQGIKPLQRKIQALQAFKTPKTQKDLLHFLGALNYYRASLKGLTIEGQYYNTAAILQPLYNAGTAKLEKVSFADVWKNSPALQIAFNNAKKLLIDAVQLAHPNTNFPIAIFVDSSDHSIGGSLEMQDPVTKQYIPCGFFSKHLNQAQKKYSVFKKELYAAHQSLRYFLPEVKGREVAIFSDHLPLCQAMDSDKLPLHDPQSHRQLMEIALFTRDLRHISGKNNLVADFFSRAGASDKIGDIYKETNDSIEIASAETLRFQNVSVQALADLQQHCEETKSCEQGQHPQNFKFENVNFDGTQLLCEVSSKQGPRPFVPQDLRQTIIHSLHAIDHIGYKSTKKRVASDYFWPAINSDIQKFVKQCDICKRIKPNKALIGPGKFPVPEQRMSHVLVDICGPLPVSHNGYKYILTCVDRASRYCSALPLKNASAQECAEAFLHGWIKHHGLCQNLTSDNGASFTANLWKNFMTDLNIEVKYTPLYRPQGVGMLERTHGPIKNGLKAALIENGQLHQEKWIDFLPWIILGKNNAYQEDLKSTASELLYGFCGKLPGQLFRSTTDQLNNQQLQELLTDQRKRNSLPAIQTSAHTKPDLPLPGLPDNIKRVYTRQHKALGLQPVFAGPFDIVERLSKSTVKLLVGNKVNGEPIYETRHLNDLKIQEPDSLLQPIERPKRGRPKKTSMPNANVIAAINFSVPPPGYSFIQQVNAPEIRPGNNNSS